MVDVIDKLKMLAAIALLVAGVSAFYVLADWSNLLRVSLLIVSVIVAAGVALTSSHGQNAWEFAKAARAEFRRIVWPNRKDTVQTTLIVIVMVFLIGLFLWLLDTISFWMIYDLFLKIGS